MLAPLLLPDLSPAYLAALVRPVGETLLLTLAAMALALPGGIALGLIATLGGWPGRWLAGFFTLLRAVPELVLAILAVVFFGLGSGAALVALTLYYLASTGKAFAELLAEAPRAPLAALERTGAGPLSLACFGYLPLAGPQMLAYGGFAFECALRASVVVGAVGGGGIGGELVGSLASFELHRASTCIIVTVALVVGLDWASEWLRARPRRLLPLLAIGLAGAALLWPRIVSPAHAFGVLAEMWPPALPAADWARLPRLLGETLAMGLGSTLAAALLAIPVSFAAARVAAPPLLRQAMRIAAAALRAVPEVVWGLILLLWIGAGPLAGATALFLHTLGSFTRLFADALDAVPAAPRRAVLRSGASPAIAALYGSLPPAMGTIGAHVLVRVDWNLRMATVLGLIGAGGIGQALYEAQQLFFYDRMLAWLLLTGLLLLAVEWLAGLAARKLGTQTGRRRSAARLRFLRPPVRDRGIARPAP